MKRFLLLLLCVFATHIGIAQNTRLVRGCVYDKDHSPIAGATISLEDESISTCSRTDGTFELRISPYETTLVASYDGHSHTKVEIDGSYLAVWLNIAPHKANQPLATTNTTDNVVADVEPYNKVEVVAKEPVDVTQQTPIEPEKHNEQIVAQQPLSPVVSGKKSTYNIGDYYDNGIQRGIVFWVTPDGKHGKIISLAQTRLPWATEKGCKKATGASTEANGKDNTTRIKKISDWQSKYPAFAWCVSLGEGWYLPSQQELSLLMNSRNVVNATLTMHNAPIVEEQYWSSIEFNEKFAWVVGMRTPLNKLGDYPVRAVYAF